MILFQDRLLEDRTMFLFFFGKQSLWLIGVPNPQYSWHASVCLVGFYYWRRLGVRGEFSTVFVVSVFFFEDLLRFGLAKSTIQSPGFTLASFLSLLARISWTSVRQVSPSPEVSAQISQTSLQQLISFQNFSRSFMKLPTTMTSDFLSQRVSILAVSFPGSFTMSFLLLCSYFSSRIEAWLISNWSCSNRISEISKVFLGGYDISDYIEVDIKINPARRKSFILNSGTQNPAPLESSGRSSNFRQKQNSKSVHSPINNISTPF